MLASRNQMLSLCALATLLVVALPAQAGLVTYTTLTGWTSAVPTSTNVDFEGLAPANSFKDYSTSTGLIAGGMSGVQFIGYENLASFDLQVVDSGLGSPFYNFGSGASLRGPSYNAPPTGFVPYTHVILPVNTSAFGVDLMTVSPNSLTYQITLSIGPTTYTVNTAARPTRTFFGVTSDTPISYVDFAVTGTTNGASTYGLMDNFRYGSAQTETPELCTLLLIGSGLIGFRMLRKFLPRQQVTQAA